MSASTLFNFTKPVSLISGILLLSGCVFHISPSVASVKQTQQLSLPSNNLEYLAILSGAGSLDIQGSNTATNISVDAIIYTADIDDEYELTLEKSGTQAKLVAQNKSNNGISFYSGQSPSINLVVTVPSTLNLDINDGSGDIVINEMQSNIDVKDGSGSLSINGAKNLNIDDGSGSIYVKNVVGDLALNDGSGSIDIDNVSGNVAIEDGSGGITIKHIKGAVTVDDNSGDMLIEHIGSSVTIEDGSGDIRVNYAKALTITEAGSGDVSIDNISGTVKLDR
ncbi:hypothetical protein CWC14_08080 [Pseudoalteromonas sp. S3260]|uniref:DUF4097 domain-containing protein n=1 Tax=Pseudoalteromonas sp. S3260 TaxID=579534 RepID=UPI00110AB371|nr:DUF4097 domain-containing protein [Pseudoalteromonas sp. S3260]TMO97707.1 hypothetical protein CWC14_08080 [Pseudoalteromonas sp. S3260]